MGFLYPLLLTGCSIGFYGGEPLLAFNVLRRTVEHVERLSGKNDRKVRYSLTTNGSLINEEILGFLDEHEFSLMLSFDGLAQDLSRRAGSFDLLASLIPRILAKPRIRLETNSVFSSETVSYLSESVRWIIQSGIRRLDVNFAHIPAWTSSSLNRFKKEIARVGEFFESRYERRGDVPWIGFYEQPGRGVFQCSAGRTQMALSAQGELWGCALFPHYFSNRNGSKEYKKYCFGPVDSFIENAGSIYSRKMANYADLRMDCYSTPDRSCLMCPEVEYCGLCPIAAALTTGKIGRIPAWACQMGKIKRIQKRLLLSQFERKDQKIKKCHQIKSPYLESLAPS